MFERDKMSNIVVFDLDGVITSEEAYWVTAGLVLHELLYSPRYWNITGGTQEYRPPTSVEECQRLSEEVLPQSVILQFKARAINANWDTCYAGVSLSLISLLAQLPDCTSLLPLRPWDANWLADFRAALGAVDGLKTINIDTYRYLDDPIFQGHTGLEFLQRFNVYASKVLNAPVEDIFAHYSPSWMFCHEIFQEWYLGDELFTQEYGHAPTQTGKRGCIYFERPLLPLEQLRTVLTTLHEQGYTLGVATGRPRPEAILPLKNYGLFHYFDESRVITHAEAVLAEARLQREGDATSLVKPHPYQFLAAFDPNYQPGQPVPPRGSFIVIGDTTSDVRGGRAAGALTIAVLSGARTAEARRMLEESEPDFLIRDVTEVPALLARLDDQATIQSLQFTEREKAEVLLRRWFARHMDLHVETVHLTPRPVSLNSFNGIYELNGEEYFFKTHVEAQGILEEYYHAELLFNAGYNVVKPLRTVHEKGQQMVVYPVVRWPVMFDLMRAVETGDTSQATIESLSAAERRECERLLEIYQRTLAPGSAEEHAKAPVHQLFWHRITGGRLASFYEGKLFEFPDQEDHAQPQGLLFEDLQRYRWTINGTPVDGDFLTLGDLIERAKIVLDPARAAQTVIGHGDAHFGNVFLEEQKLYQYFDPAFSGRHSPLLDIVKPFFHNIFATWMYFPREVAQDLKLSVAVHGDRIFVEHNYYPLPSVRQAMLRTKIDNLLKPLLALLREHDALPDDWEDQFRLALMCCPLLTVNLLDREKRSAALGWLGLSQVMQMGNLAVLKESGL
jgi:phosphoglycolate phosphatase-like HAD superfamily hydrolase